MVKLKRSRRTFYLLQMWSNDFMSDGYAHQYHITKEGAKRSLKRIKERYKDDKSFKYMLLLCNKKEGVDFI